jgi:hypothetical protein
MKKHYYIEIVLLLLLSIAAATLAADHHFYEVVWKLTGLDKNHFDHTVTLVRMIGFGSIIFFSIANIWKHLHSERKIIKSLIASVHKIFFERINVKNPNGIYRITAHKYYKFSWIKTGIYLILYISSFILIGTPLVYQIDFLPKLLQWFVFFVLITLFLYFILWVFDDWWYQFLWRLRKLKSNRFLTVGKNYLLSHERFGFESGQPNTENTTIPFLVRGETSSRLFTGKVYESKDEFETSLNHHGINQVITKFNEKRRENSEEYIADNKTFSEYLNFSLKMNIDKLKQTRAFTQGLEEAEQNKIIKFMEETNTLAFDLFDINNHIHCEHFLGFKIYSNKDSIWGVVVIDVKHDSNQEFYELLGIELQSLMPQDNITLPMYRDSQTLNSRFNEEWLHIFLRSYSELFSRAILNKK